MLLNKGVLPTSMKNNETGNKLKILVGYHKPAELVKDDIFFPIQLGHAIGSSVSKEGIMEHADFEWLEKRMIGDDVGENISAFNRSYCELTGIYWAWKNYEKLGNPDYVGTAHYRRFLSFCSSEVGKAIFIPCLSEEDKDIHLNASSFLQTIDQYDIYAPKRTSAQDILSLKTKKTDSSCSEIIKRESLVDVRSEKVRDRAVDYIKRRWTEYKADALEYKNHAEEWRWNIFIFKKEIFFSYCEFIFDVLSSVNDSILSDPLISVSYMRSISFLGEWLTGLFIYHHSHSEGRSLKELPVLMAGHTTPAEFPVPAYSEQNVAICLTTDDRYIYDCAVSIRSLIANSSNENNYDIVIAYNSLSKENRTLLHSLGKENNNVSIRFLFIGRLLTDSALQSHGYYGVTVYYRLFIPLIYRNYKKVIYLDSDTILERDVAQLYNTELGNHWVAACRDYGVMVRVRQGGRESEEYHTGDLGLPHGSADYFNSGVLIFNVDAFKQNNLFAAFLEHMQSQRKKVFASRKVKSWVDIRVGPLFLFPDQDILNIVCHDHVLYLNPSWNVLIESGLRKGSFHFLPEQMYEAYLASREDPFIIHYAGGIKPRSAPRLDMAEAYWHYARQLPFYEAIIYDNILREVDSKYKKREQLMKELVALPNNKRNLKKLRYKIFFSFGKLRESYKKEINRLKSCIKRARKFAKQS